MLRSAGRSASRSARRRQGKTFATAVDLPQKTDPNIVPPYTRLLESLKRVNAAVNRELTLPAVG
jgi:hypothetical protein